MIRVFIDESGTPDKYISGVHQVHDKYFTLAAVIINQIDYTNFKLALDALCVKYEQYLLNKEIKSNYIRTSNPRTIRPNQTPEYIFYQFPDGLIKYDEFCAELRAVLSEANFKIISVSTDKEIAGKKWPTVRIHEYIYNDLWERLSIHVVLRPGPKTRMRIVFDRTKGQTDIIFKDSYKRFIYKGTRYIDQKTLATLKLDKDVYSCDSEDSLGLQLADLMAYPIKRYMEKGVHKFFEDVVKAKLHPKVHDKRSDTYINMGTKRSMN